MTELEIPPELINKATELIDDSQELKDNVIGNIKRINEKKVTEGILFTFRGIKFSKRFIFTIAGAVALIVFFLFLDSFIPNPQMFKSLDKYIKKNLTIAPIFIALLSSFVFGAVDNFGLFLGIDAIEDVIRQIFPNASDKTIAGLGNTFSDIIGAFAGTSIANILTKVLRVYINPSPVVDALGITLGCLTPVILHNFKLF